MSKITEYIEAAIGYDAEGLPASTVQFTFGMAPFQVAESENIDDVTEITAMCQADPIVDIKIIDNMVKASFDFSMDTNTFAEFAEELELYQQQQEHVTESVNMLMNQLAVAERNENESEIEEIYFQVRKMTVPFLVPTILPVALGGDVHIGFADDPKFIFFTSDQLNQMPHKVTMIFEATDLFCQDEMGIYFEDPEAEMLEQQEELWYMQEAQKMEEEAYQAEFGANASLYGEEEQAVDKRLKGVRFK